MGWCVPAVPCQNLSCISDALCPLPGFYKAPGSCLLSFTSAVLNVAMTNCCSPLGRLAVTPGLAQQAAVVLGL